MCSVKILKWGWAKVKKNIKNTDKERQNLLESFLNALTVDADYWELCVETSDSQDKKKEFACNFTIGVAVSCGLG